MSDDILIPFPQPLKQRLWKTVTEYFALLVLQHCFPHQYETLEKGESPDLQSPDHQVGVEVTLAVSQREAQIDSQYYREQGDDTPEMQRRRCIQRIACMGGGADEYSFSYPAKYLEEEKAVWQNALRKKMKKLPYYRTKNVQHLHLFVVYEEPPIPVQPGVWKEWLDEVLQDYDDCYEIIYICYLCGMLVYEVGKQTLQIVRIDRTDICRLKYKARQIVEKLETYRTEKTVEKEPKANVPT